MSCISVLKVLDKELAELTEARFKILDKAKDSTKYQKYLYSRCKDDSVYFFNNFLWTFNPKVDPKHFPFVLFPGMQEDYCRSIAWEIENGKGSATEKSREVGATFIVLGNYLHRWAFHDDFEALCMTLKAADLDNPTESSLFGKIRYMGYRLPWFLMPEGFDRRQHGDTHNRWINPDNGNSIIGLCAGEDAGRSNRKTCVLVDESAFINARISEGLEKALNETTNCLHRVSTPKGINQFKMIVDSGKVRVHTLHWSRIPDKRLGLYYLDKLGRRVECEKLKWDCVSKRGFFTTKGGSVTKHRLRSIFFDGKSNDYLNPKDVESELNLNYQGSSNCRFDAEMIENGVANCIPGEKGRLEKNKDGEINFIPMKDTEAWELEVWHRPKKPYFEHRSFIGADTSEGLAKGDPSCADVGIYDLKGRYWKHAATLHGRWTPDVFADKVDLLGRWYDDGAKVAVERNKDGLGVLRRLKRDLNYNNLYYETREGSTKGELGFLTTQAKKFEITEALDAAFRAGEFECRSINHYSEFSTFENDDGKLGAQGGFFDDRVMSMCILWWIMHQFKNPSLKAVGPVSLKKVNRFDTSKF